MVLAGTSLWVHVHQIDPALVRASCPNNICNMSHARCTLFKSHSQGMEILHGRAKAFSLSKGPIWTNFEGKQATPKLPKKKTAKRRPGLSNHHFYLFKRTGQFETGTKAKMVVDLLLPLPNVKEEIYAVLDEWVAFEVEFPIIALGKALKRLKQQEQWQRIIQLAKWMLSKGQGKTFGTYDMLLKAYEMDARIEDCEDLWEKLLSSYTRSMPKSMFSRMMNIYKRQDMPRKVVEIFEQMEDLNMKPDRDMLELVTKAYRQVGQLEKEAYLLDKYPPAWEYIRFQGRTIKVRPRCRVKQPIAEMAPEEGSLLVCRDGP